MEQSFLKENLEILPTTTMRNLLDNMENDISWLIRLIENLLNMTKIQDKALTIHKKSEIIDDLISEAVSKMIKYKGKHEIIIQPTEQIEFIQVDSHLLVQVFINIIDNAFKHTREDSKIVITTKKRDTRMLIEIADDGGGMDETQLVHIFESFFYDICRKRSASWTWTWTGDLSNDYSSTFWYFDCEKQ